MPHLDGAAVDHVSEGQCHWFLSCDSQRLTVIPTIKIVPDGRISTSVNSIFSFFRKRTMKVKQSTIVVPKKKSVAELAHWLSQFGDKNRDHFEKGPFQTNVHQPLTQQHAQTAGTLPYLSSSSSESGSTSVASPPTTTKLAFVPKSLAHAEMPAFRNFEAEDTTNLFTSAAHSCDDDLSKLERDEFRGVAITKLLDPPQPHNHRSSFLSWDASDDFQDPWDVPLWHPNVSPRSKVFADDATPLPFEKDGSNTVLTGCMTDPGEGPSSWCGRNVRRDTTSREDCHSDANNNVESIRCKLPLLLCKSRSDKEAGDASPHRHDFVRSRNSSPVSLTLSDSVCTGPQELECDNWTMYSTSLFVDDSTFASGTFKPPIRNLSSSPQYPVTGIMSEETTVSTLDEDSVFAQSTGRRTVKANLGDVFDQEVELENLMSSLNDVSMKKASETGTTKKLPVGRNANVTTARSSIFTTARTTASAPRSRSSAAKQQRAQEVACVIAQFGGPARSYKKSSVQLRREQLEKKWAEDRPLIHSKKVMWQVANGAYKKQVKLDYLEK